MRYKELNLNEALFRFPCMPASQKLISSDRVQSRPVQACPVIAGTIPALKGGQIDDATEQSDPMTAV